MAEYMVSSVMSIRTQVGMPGVDCQSDTKTEWDRNRPPGKLPNLKSGPVKGEQNILSGKVAFCGALFLKVQKSVLSLCASHKTP